MIHYKIYFQPYDWEVEVYLILNHCCIDTIMNSLCECSQSEIQKAFLNITTRINSGFIKTFNKRSIIVINKHRFLCSKITVLPLEICVNI